jgi:hypothetical protein
LVNFQVSDPFVNMNKYVRYLLLKFSCSFILSLIYFLKLFVTITS